MNRSLLKRLRPVALGRVTLSELIDELVAEFGRRHAGVSIRCSNAGIAASYSEAADLTVYRAIQEGMTNALRHAEATEISVDLSEQAAADGSAIRLTIEDNGAGLSPNSAPGFGLRAMRERVRAQGGTFSIAGGPGRGTRIEIAIPVTKQIGTAIPLHEIREQTP